MNFTTRISWSYLIVLKNLLLFYFAKGLSPGNDK